MDYLQVDNWLVLEVTLLNLTLDLLEQRFDHYYNKFGWRLVDLLCLSEITYSPQELIKCLKVDTAAFDSIDPGDIHWGTLPELLVVLLADKGMRKLVQILENFD